MISTKTKKYSRWTKFAVHKILISKKYPYGTNKSIKYFIGYNDYDAIRPPCIKLSQMIRYFECFDGNKTISFKVTDKKLLKNYTKIREKVSNLMDIKFHSEPIYCDNDKKLKIGRDKVNTNFQGKKWKK